MLTERIGFISTSLKALVGLTPTQIHRIVSRVQDTISIVIYPTRFRIVTQHGLNAPVTHIEESYEEWWYNIRNWDKYSEDLIQALLTDIESYTRDGVVLEKENVCEDLISIVKLMIKGSGLKEVSIQFYDERSCQIVYVDELEHRLNLSFKGSNS